MKTLFCSEAMIYAVRERRRFWSSAALPIFVVAGTFAAAIEVRGHRPTTGNKWRRRIDC